MTEDNIIRIFQDRKCFVCAEELQEEDMVILDLLVNITHKNCYVNYENLNLNKFKGGQLHPFYSKILKLHDLLELDLTFQESYDK